jgi:1-acyl-sn-glycerol-3-phosphate acyltransferase
MGIRSKLSRQWRICAMGLAFVTFIIGSVIFTFTIVPLIKFLPESSGTRRHKMLKLVHLSFKLLIKYAILLKIIATFEVERLKNVEHYNRCIFVANHPTLIDAIAIMSCIPFCSCIVKGSLFNHTYFGSIVRAAGYVVNDDAAQLMKDCEKTFQAGHSLIVFPEGTRSPAYGLHTFKRGAARIALRTGVPIVLVVITCDPPILAKGQAWYQVPDRPVRFKLHFHPLSALPEEIQQTHNFPLKVRALNQSFEDFFRERLHVSTHVD